MAETSIKMSLSVVTRVTGQLAPDALQDHTGLPENRRPNPRDLGIIRSMAELFDARQQAMEIRVKVTGALAPF
jgi:hypothetical protein